ncbi:hypothetical protein L1283_002644 [Sphingobacterium sp. HSC-15S19]
MKRIIVILLISIINAVALQAQQKNRPFHLRNLLSSLNKLNMAR